jgi:hypothetical protein
MNVDLPQESQHYWTFHVAIDLVISKYYQSMMWNETTQTGSAINERTTKLIDQK